MEKKLLFNKLIYNKEAIDQTLSDFSDIIQADIFEDNQYYQINLSIDDAHSNYTDDFCNFALYYSIQQ